MWINVPSVLAYELHWMTEQIQLMKSTLKKLQVEINALMETIKEQNSNLKSMEWELYVNKLQASRIITGLSGLSTRTGVREFLFKEATCQRKYSL